MIKKTFEKEPYVAPQWGVRVITVERHILENSPGTPGSDDTIVDEEDDY